MTESQKITSVLVVDDDTSLRDSIAANLEQENYLVRTAADASAGLQILKDGSFDIILSDFSMPSMDGIEFLGRCRDYAPAAAVVMMTAYGNLDLAIKAIRAGAYDYISKPFAFETLLLALKKIEERERLIKENDELKQELDQRYNFSNIIAHSQVMHGIFETVRRLANYNTTVLITGESGTGKELVARALHHNSPRRSQPFVAINCGAIPENLMESELFGHRKGAFTDATRDKKGLLEEASGGTVFFDEIGELPMHLQVKLLRALQEQQIRRVGDEGIIKVDLRVIAATLRNLEDDVGEGRFREDLLYRLNVVSIHIPPLRERAEDIPVLVQHFLKKHNKRLGLNIKEVEPDAMKCMMQHVWRGNVRELENCVERALVLTESGKIDFDSLPEPVKAGGGASEDEESEEKLSPDNISIKAHTRALEVDLIRRALKQTGGNRTHAAKVLEISHRALLYKLKEYGLAGKGE